MTTPLIDLAYKIALKAHKEQSDMGGNPYIGHLTRVASKFNREELIVTALLHDILEDTSITEYELLSYGIPGNIVETIKLLTRKQGVTYRDYIKSLQYNKTAIEVKLSDLEDNMNLERLNSITKRDIDRVNKRYRPAYEFLSSKLLDYN